jgi:hypothetical protein
MSREAVVGDGPLRVNGPDGFLPGPRRLSARRSYVFGRPEAEVQSHETNARKLTFTCGGNGDLRSKRVTAYSALIPTRT